MREAAETTAPQGARRLASTLLFCVICVAVNFIGSQLTSALGSPLYLDSIGTVLSGVFGGYIPGAAVGYVTNMVTSALDPISIYYCLSNVLIAISASFFAHRGWFDKIPTILLAVVVFALIGGVLGSVITWYLYGVENAFSSPFAQQIYDATGCSPFLAQVCSDFLVDLADKGITVVIAVIVIRVLPKWLINLFDFTIWQQKPLEGEQLAAAQHAKTRALSLRTKIATILGVVMVIVAIATTSMSFIMYHRSNIEAQGRMAMGVASLAAEKVDADRVEEFLEKGEDAPGYADVEAELSAIRESSPEIQYIYVYKIMEDGCHVVLDPDTEDELGSEPGSIVPFDTAFESSINDLLTGKAIDPVVSNETYGWLLTAYKPIFNSGGQCAAYVAVDISMDTLVADETSFLVRVIILFGAFFVLVCAIAIWLAEYGIIMPINSIASGAGSFAFDDQTSRESSVNALRDLDVHTGDELENLYHVVTKTSEDTVQFIGEAHEKAETIERMQDNLILVMADLVESRDQFTGDHVRKTAAYTQVTMDEMRREGMYPDELTDEFIANVTKSAPLHDIGKIVVSDTILNKPGRLTDEEFDIMRRHTVAGAEILESSKGAVSEESYLDEACRLAAYHHEKWNGKGYPYGLSGEEIPLSARIMAVADVFDALVSKRSYKEGMPIEKAFDIIRKDAGSHFDPLVAQAFLNAEAEVRKIAEDHGDANGTAADIRDD